MAILSPKKTAEEPNASPGFIRHMAIVAYDGLLLVALLFLATALILPFNKGEAFTSSQYFFPLYILLVSYLYYGWFWVHGGQTLGMKTWKIKIQTLDRKPITWPLALKRFLLAIISWGFVGLGFLWKFVDKNQLSWHDHGSKTGLFFEDGYKK